MRFLVPDPIYCRNATAGQLECDGQHATQFYTALLTFALYWNTTLASEGAMDIDVPVHGVDVANFAKHSIVREMITRRDGYRESCRPARSAEGPCSGHADAGVLQTRDTARLQT